MYNALDMGDGPWLVSTFEQDGCSVAGKRKKQSRKARASRPPRPQNATSLLQSAIHALRREKPDEALHAASLALGKADSQQMADTAREVLAEANFRNAVTCKQLHRRLQLLEEALQHAPSRPRLRFHRGITLWQMGQLAEAVRELDAVVACEPERKGLDYLHRLAHLATGKVVEWGELPADQANTLALIQAVVRDGKQPRISSLLEGPLMGRSPEMWQALAEMHHDTTAAPVASLKSAADRDGRKPIVRFLHYYRGVAAMRQGDHKMAEVAWRAARSAGLDRPWLAGNLRTNSILGV